MVNKAFSLSRICRQFQLDGEFLGAAPFGEGHIHATFVTRFRQQDGTIRRYLLQHINRQVFPEPEKVMENIEHVTEHLRRKIISAGGDPLRNTINLMPARDGKSFYQSDDGEYWRAEGFIENASSYHVASSPGQYFKAAKAFGEFQRYLADFPVDQLHVTIPDFHHTGKRFEQFADAVKRDAVQRASEAQTEIEFAIRRVEEANHLVDLAAAGVLPERVTHNDAKLDNILMDDRSGEGICVIDLDTVMPGLAVYDFGDIVRSGANTAGEDEQNPAQVKFDLQIYEHIVHGFLEATRNSLTSSEIDQLPFAAQLITFEQGLRFLADYLNGDKYYRIHRPRHNLERCRTQFKLVSEMETKFDAMVKVLELYR